MGKYVDFYCGDYNRELKKIVEPILKNQFSWLAQKDYDNFYSIAAGVVWDCEKKFDENRVRNREFKSYVSACIQKRMKARLTYMHRQKRILKDGQGNPVYEISMDAPAGGEDGRSVGEALASDFNLDDVVLQRLGFYEERVSRYLCRLTKTQREIVRMKMEGISPRIIRKRLGITDKEYELQFTELKSFANMRALYDVEEEPDRRVEAGRKETAQAVKECRTDRAGIAAMGKCRTNKISIAAMIDRIDRHTLRFDHPFQRTSGQWTPSMKGNLISDILQGNRITPLVFAEQILDGRTVVWDLDGKQRCATVYTFCRNGYRLPGNIRRFMISYYTAERDGNGRKILDENGCPKLVGKAFDIRGKWFCDLPRELRERILNYQFIYDEYLDCSEADLEYHMERFNDRKPMTACQKGAVKLGSEAARRVNAITEMAFFKDLGDYRISEFRNGVLRRVVAESVAAAYFPEALGKDFARMCAYLKNHGTSGDFDRFASLVGRLEQVVTEETARLFNSGNSFLLFGLFARFVDLGIEDKRFADFLEEVSNMWKERGARQPLPDGLKLDGKAGKEGLIRDKCAVEEKMKRLEAWMKNYLRSDCCPDRMENCEKNLPCISRGKIL